MAKSVHQKKKRIAHFQNAIENFSEGGYIFDYVSSIIQNMDDNFNSVHSSSKESTKTKLINTNRQRDNSLSNVPSTSNDSQKEKNCFKSNKFSVSRKYPLMEKTQKILKQLKHNRKIPKPRAHLSSVQKSPLKVDYKMPIVQKKKQPQKEVRKLQNNISSYNGHDTDSIISNCKISENLTKVDKNGRGENTVLENLNRHFSRNDLCNSNTKKCSRREAVKNKIGESLSSATQENCWKKGVNITVEGNSLCDATPGTVDDENDTTDSEYERFVKKNKKGLQKKVLKQKHSKAKRKISKKESLKVSESTVQRENIPEQYDSDDSDNILSSNFKKTSPFKKLRVSNDIPTEVETGNVINEESESEVIADDICTRDSSSECDITDNEASICDRTKPPFENTVCSVSCETDSEDMSNTSNRTLPNISSFIHKESASEACNLIVNNIIPNNEVPFSPCINTSYPGRTKSNNIVPNNDLPFSSRISTSDSGRTKSNNTVLNNDLPFSSCINTSDSGRTTSNNILPNNDSPFSSFINISDSGKTEPNNISPNLLVIDLCDSGDECTNIISDEFPTVALSKRIITDVAVDLHDSDDECKNMSDKQLSAVALSKKEKYIETDVEIDLCESDDECKNLVSGELPTVTIPKKEKCIVTDVAIDLCNSDDNDKNVNTDKPNVLVPKEEKCVLNVSQSINLPDSEESDLEIIEITSTNSTKVQCIISKAFSIRDKEAYQVVEADIRNNVSNKCMQTVIKTEESRSVHAARISHIKNQNEEKADDSKHDAVYMTNICRDFKKDKLVLLGNTSSVSSIHNKEIKTEIPEIIIDSVKGVKYSSDILKMDVHRNYQHQKCSDSLINVYQENTTIKKECSLENLPSSEKKFSTDYVTSKSRNSLCSEDELKSFKICSDSKMYPQTLYSDKQQFQELEQMNMAHLLELFKKEFQAYQEIIQTEASVEAHLKKLETHQAEKLKYIRSLVQKYVGNNLNVSDTSSNSVKVQECKNNILPKTETLNTLKTFTADKSSLFTLTDLSHDTMSSYPNAQGEGCYFSKFSDVPRSSPVPQTAVLSSKIDRDIKPNIYSLDEMQKVQQLPHCAVKPKEEVEFSQASSQFQSGKKQTLKLLKEKCNVCGKEAMAACQRCAKVFFCSHECGKKFWIEGHEDVCGK